MKPSPQSSQVPLILVVDDDPLVRKMLNIMLERAGFQVEIAVNGQEALTKIKRLLPDLITLDHMMPDVTGEEVRALMAQDEQTRKIPIIFVSAVAEDLEKRYAAAAINEPVRFLSKPFNRELLLGYVRELLGWKGAEG